MQVLHQTEKGVQTVQCQTRVVYEGHGAEAERLAAIHE